jgi:hypothetical protein
LAWRRRPDWLADGQPEGSPTAGKEAADPVLLTQLGLAGVLAGFVLTALARAKKLGNSWEDRGLLAIFGGFGLIMVGVVLAIATSE